MIVAGETSTTTPLPLCGELLPVPEGAAADHIVRVYNTLFDAQHRADSREQAQVLRRVQRVFARARKAAALCADDYSAVCTHLARCMLFGTAQPAGNTVSSVLCSAVAQILDVAPETGTVRADRAALVDAFVRERLCAAEQPAAAREDAVAKLLACLDVPELLRCLQPHVGAAVAFLDAFLRDTVPDAGALAAFRSALVRSASFAIKGFVGTAARFPAETCAAVCRTEGRGGAVLRAAFVLMSNRNFSKEFLSASGLAVAVVVVARARANTSPAASAVALYNALYAGYKSNSSAAFVAFPFSVGLCVCLLGRVASEWVAVPVTTWALASVLVAVLLARLVVAVGAAQVLGTL